MQPIGNFFQEKGPDLATGAPISDRRGVRSGGLLATVVLDLFEVGVDDIVAALGGTGRRLVAASGGLGLGRLVHGLPELHRDFGKTLALGLDGFGVGLVLLEFGLEIRDGVLDGLAIVGADLVAVFGQSLFGRVDQAVGRVLGLDQVLAAVGDDRDVARLHRRRLETGEGVSLEDFLRAELGDVIGKHGGDEGESTDVVLYGFGRIGRLLARILIEHAGTGHGLRLRAIVVRKGADNDLSKRASLLRRDSVHGSFAGTITVDEEASTVSVKLTYNPKGRPKSVETHTYELTRIDGRIRMTK